MARAAEKERLRLAEAAEEQRRRQAEQASKKKKSKVVVGRLPVLWCMLPRIFERKHC